jgi:hypothetical protein
MGETAVLALDDGSMVAATVVLRGFPMSTALLISLHAAEVVLVASRPLSRLAEPSKKTNGSIPCSTYSQTPPNAAKLSRINSVHDGRFLDARYSIKKSILNSINQ